MTQVGHEYQGIWPENPIKPSVGLSVLYPEAQTGIIRRATIMTIGTETVYLSNGDWCYIHELSSDVAD